MKKKNANLPKPTLAAKFPTAPWRVYQAGFAPDSKTLVLVAHDEIGVAIVDVGTWKMRTLPELECTLDHLVFSPDGTSFVLPIGPDDPTQCLQTTAALKWEIKPGSMDAAFSPDGKTLAITRSKRVLLIDAATGKTIREMAGHTKRVDDVVFSSDGRRIASVGQSQVCLWDARSGKLVAVVKEPPGEVHVIAFSPDSRSLAVADAKGVMRLYDPVSGKQQHEWQAHGCNIFYLAFTSESQRLITQSFVGDDLSLRVWEFPSCRQIHQFPGAQTSFHLTPDEKAVVLLVAGVPQIRSLATWELCSSLWKKPLLMSTLAFSPDGNWMVCIMDNGETQVWRITGALPPG